jgi:hypothetical protein
VRRLNLWEAYTREEVHNIFDPDNIFTPQAGTWGLQGIVRVPNSEGNFIFFVTFGKRQGAHDFEEAITQDGVLTWQSQPRQRLDSGVIQQLIGHNDITNSIHLFLRTRSGISYTYFGELGYLDHDPDRETPVYFTWQLMNWPPPRTAMQDLGIAPVKTKAPRRPLVPQEGQLIKTDPPSVRSPGPAPMGAPGKQAVLPTQDAKNRKLGLAGEQLVLKAERKHLQDSGCDELANKLVHVSVIEGDSAGYDIRSYNVDGTTRHIEVKTTQGPAANAFFLSPNEVRFSEENPNTFVLVRVYGYSYETNSANYYEATGSLTNVFDLTTSEYRARLIPTEHQE